MKEKLISRKCQLCGSNEHDHYLRSADYFFTKEEFDIVKCKECGFLYTDPIPNENLIGSYYESSNYLSHQAENKNLTAWIYRTIRNINVKKKFSLVQKFKPDGNVLEIGTGTGELLNYFQQKGWKTIGIEPNENACEYARSTYGLDISDENRLNELKLKSFDVIMLWHVLEHVYDLRTRMKQIKNLLKETGFIFIAVPNINSPDFKKYGKYWAGLDLPRHLYHFNENSIRKLLQNHALKLISSYPMKFDAFYVSLLGERYLGNSAPYFRAFFNGYNANLKAKKENNYSSMIFVATEY
jgi:2-polyprenyl-3-methyl-5-hydroxy-6-metoxy-1,4-benzoquinol methylase